MLDIYVGEFTHFFYFVFVKDINKIKKHSLPFLIKNFFLKKMFFFVHFFYFVFVKDKNKIKKHSLPFLLKNCFLKKMFFFVIILKHKNYFPILPKNKKLSLTVFCFFPHHPKT